ncbi:MAG: response regulator [Lachnospiraceae bacterium]|nr:response regulator [Lachnospiraceae bacterium]
MPQFLLGFWCGCVFSVLLVFLIYYSVRKRREQGVSRKEAVKKRDVSKNEKTVQDSKARILLVDDSKLSRKLIKDFLRDRPIEIAEAESGAECLLKCRKEKYDLIFMDLNMPGGSGLETLERLKNEAKGFPQMPVIVMGSNVRQESEAGYLELGFDGCLAKPIQMNRLEEILMLNLPEEALQQIPEGFFYQKGLDNFDGNEALYKETLLLFSTLWEERKEQLQRFLDEENMTEYAILIHAVKGDARILGADFLAELAYEQELSAKEQNVKAVRNSFSKVIETGTKTAEYFMLSFSE